MILVDLTLATRRPQIAGIERFGLNLFRALRATAGDTVALVAAGNTLIGGDGVLPVAPGMRGWIAVPSVAGRVLRSGKDDVVLCPSYPPSPVLALTRRHRVARIIHDDFPWTRPEDATLRSRLLFRDVESMLMRRYDVVAAPTALVADALSRRFDRAVHVCGNAPGVDLSAVAAVPVAQLVGRRFVLLVGTVEPRKNYDALLAMLALGSADAPVFVVAGRAGWGEIVHRMSRASRDPRLVWLDDASDGSLAWLYRHCAAFVSLSLAEGFNMPLAEATGAGCPIVCTDNAVHRDVAPASATFVSASDPDETLAAIMRASALPRRDGSEFRARYSWSSVADAVLRLVH